MKVLCLFIVLCLILMGFSEARSVRVRRGGGGGGGGGFGEAAFKKLSNQSPKQS